jgi:hypothetical protein
MPSTADENPYASPVLAETAVARPHKTRWQWFAAGLFISLGSASFAFGLLAVAIMVRAFLTRTNIESAHSMIAGCSLYLGVGISWLFAGYFYSTGRYKLALAATAIGILIPTVLFSLFGFHGTG